MFSNSQGASVAPPHEDTEAGHGIYSRLLAVAVLGKGK